jgi:hypothetical protein
MESVLRDQIAEGKPVPNEIAVFMLEAIDALRAQVAQLQIDVQQAQAESNIARSDYAALRDKIAGYSGVKI